VQVQRSRLLEGKQPLAGLPAVDEPISVGIRTAVNRYGASQKRPPRHAGSRSSCSSVTTAWPEYASLACGDVVVSVEYCSACWQHAMSFRHSAEEFASRAAAVADEVTRQETDHQPTSNWHL
jgi:hypothetical protein